MASIYGASPCSSTTMRTDFLAARTSHIISMYYEEIRYMVYILQFDTKWLPSMELALYS